MKREFIVEKNGKSFVLYAGLLDAAHERGLKSITTTLVQIPGELNGQSAIVHATVETTQGVFTGLGDADHSNVSRMMIPHLIRMAETRAKARALRDAVNVGVTSLEELGGDDDEQPEARPAATKSAPPRRSGAATPEEHKAATPVDEQPATPTQLETIRKLAESTGTKLEGDMSKLTRKRASALISQLSDKRYGKRNG